MESSFFCFFIICAFSLAAGIEDVKHSFWFARKSERFDKILLHSMHTSACLLHMMNYSGWTPAKLAVSCVICSSFRSFTSISLCLNFLRSYSEGLLIINSPCTVRKGIFLSGSSGF